MDLLRHKQPFPRRGKQLAWRPINLKKVNNILEQQAVKHKSSIRNRWPKWFFGSLAYFAALNIRHGLR
jgi:hypothetical protein